MKPITGLPVGLLTSVVIIVSLAFIGSRIPDSTAAVADEEASQAAEEAVAPAVEGLEIIITGIRNDKGKIIVAVFDTDQLAALIEDATDLEESKLVVLSTCDPDRMAAGEKDVAELDAGSLEQRSSEDVT